MHGLGEDEGASKIAAVSAIVGIVGSILPAIINWAKGCGETCINASKVEQIYEAAALNVEEVGNLHMISRDEAIAGMQMFAQAGQQHEAQIGDEHAQAGAENLTKVIGDIIARSQSLPTEATKPLNLDEARGAYVRAGSYGKEWYDGSLSAAGQLADQYLSGLAASPERQITQAAGQVESALKRAGIPPWAALAAAGVAIIWWSNR